MKRYFGLLGIALGLLLSTGSHPREVLAATTSMPARPARVFCSALSTTNISRSGPQTVDTVSLVSGSIACLVGESDNKNGAYLVQSGTWKAIDPGLGTGLELYAVAGSANVNALYGCDTTGAVVWGTTSTVFTRKSATGSTFNPAVPGTLGGTTPGVVNASDLYLATAASSAAAGKLLLNATASQNSLVITAAGGSNISLGQDPSTATARVAVRTVAVTLANNGTYDFNQSALGGSAVIATSDGSIVATVGFSGAAVTSTGGVTYDNFSTTLTTASKLNVAASGGLLRFENKTGSTINVVATITMFVAG
jgi:hypothetical protein